MVDLMRGWLDEASLSVAQFHQKLTPEHFIGTPVPELRRLRDQLAGDALELDLVEAVADVCFEHEAADRTARRLREARALWQQAQTSPTPLNPAQELALTQELLDARNHIIKLYEDMQGLRAAYEASEHGRQQALQIVTLLFAMLGQARAAVAELKRQIDGLPQFPEVSQEYQGLELRLSRAQRQKSELGAQLARAEQERDTAQHVAEHAARRIRALQDELDELRLRMGQDGPAAPGSPVPQTPGPDPSPISHDAVLDDMDRALEKVRAVLDEEHEAVQQAAHDVGYRPPTAQTPAGTGSPHLRTLPGQVRRAPDLQHAHPAERSARPSRLSRTTPDNRPRLRDRFGLLRRRGDAMRVDLRDRIRVQSRLPQLPAGWHREMALRPGDRHSYGGDFVVATLTNAGGTLEVALTDVSGRGTDAASRALLLSGAFSGLLGSVPPHEFLPAANRYLLRQDWEEGFATTLHLVLDLNSGEYELFSAGHPPALQRSAGSGCWEEKTASGRLLGLDTEAQFTPARGLLNSGDVLMLFTDGLVETPNGDISDGIDRLTGEADRHAPNSFHGAAWHLIKAVDRDVDDDRALLLIRRDE